MKPDTIGPYRVVRTIGAGGMGTVFEGARDDTGALAAIKTVSRDTVGVETLRALRREVEVLAELDHPHIVKVIDFDLESESPWFAMEYIDGKPFSTWNRESTGDVSTADTLVDIASRTTLENYASFHRALDDAREQLKHEVSRAQSTRPELAAEAWSPDADLRTRLAWLGQVTRALQFLHGLNIVHGDVKPDNVLIDNDGRAVLVDFGLVSRRDARVTQGALARSLTRAQTLEYAAPERHIRADFDARADLYAIGCMLYEVFSGAPPFTGAPSAVAIAHVVQPVPPIEDAVQPPTGQIWSLIESLLAKDPNDRVAYATQVCAVLEDHAIATNIAGRTLPETRPYLYQPAFVGFDAEFAAAREVIKAPRRGEKVVQVIGPEGSGKSRFLLETAALALQGGQRVHLLSAGDGGRQQVPFAALRFVFDYLVDMCRAGRWRPSADAFWIATVEPRLTPYLRDTDRALLDELDGVPLKAARKAVARAVVSALNELASTKPICFVVDSLDTLEEGAREALHEIVRRSESEPLSVIATATNVDEAFKGALAIELPRLQTADVAMFASQVLGGGAVDETTVELLRAQSDGRPAALLELMNAVFEAGLIEQDRRGAWRGAQGQDLAEAVGTMVRSKAADPAYRVNQLAPFVREVAEIGAVLGRAFALSDVIDISKRRRGEVSIAISELLSGRILAEGNFGDAAYPKNLVFFSRRMHESLCASLSDARKRALHVAAAEVMQSRGDLPAVARHFETAADDRAFQAYWRAAEEARHNGTPAVRLACLEGALRVGDQATTEERETLLYRRYSVLTDSSPSDVVRANSETILESVRTPVVRARIFFAFFSRMLFDAQPEAVRRYVAEVEELAEYDDPSASVPAHSTLTLWHRYFDRKHEAIDAGRNAVRAAEGANLALRLQANVALGNVLFRYNELDEALESSMNAVEIARELGEAEKLQTAMSRVVAARAMQGHFAEVHRQLEPIAEFQKRARLLSGYLISLWNMAYASHALGNFAESLATLDESDSVHERYGIEHDEGEYLGRRSAALASLGHIEESVTLARRAVDRAARKQTRAHARLQLCDSLAVAGRYAESLDILDEMPPDDDAAWASMWHYFRAQACIGLGRFADAEHSLAIAKESLVVPHEREHLRYLEACLAMKQGRFDDARRELETALEWFEDYEFRYDSALTRLELVRCIAATGGEISSALLQPIRNYVASQPFTDDAPVVTGLREAEGLAAS